MSRFLCLPLLFAAFSLEFCASHSTFSSFTIFLLRFLIISVPLAVSIRFFVYIYPSSSNLPPTIPFCTDFLLIYHDFIWLLRAASYSEHSSSVFLFVLFARPPPCLWLILIPYFWIKFWVSNTKNNLLYLAYFKRVLS